VGAHPSPVSEGFARFRGICPFQRDLPVSEGFARFRGICPFQRDLPVSEEYEYLAPKKLTKKERVRYGKKTEGL